MTNEEAIKYWEEFKSEIADVFGKDYPKEAEEQTQSVELALSALREQAEIVKCKNCIYQKDAKVNCKGFIICPASNMEITDDDYCSYGERRESEVSE